jgi:hypothetical protein
MASQPQPPKPAPQQPEERKPVQSWSYPSSGGYIEVSVWENQIQGDNGERVSHSVTFQRSYKQGQTWQHTKSVFARDIPILRFLLEKAFDWTFEEGQKK